MENNKFAISKRFYEERKKTQENRSELSRLLEIPSNTIKKWEEGTEIPGSAIGKLEAAGIDMQYVLTGKHKELPVIELPEITNEDFREIPFYPDEIAAGRPLEMRDQPEGIVVVHRDWCKNPDKMVAVRVSKTGTSMEPTIPAGAIVTIDISKNIPEPLFGEVIVIYKKDDGCTLKRLGKTDKGWCGIPDNRSFEHNIVLIDFENNDRIVGKVNSVHYTL